VAVARAAHLTSDTHHFVHSRKRDSPHAIISPMTTDIPSVADAPQTLADRLRRVRAATFVGRTPEIELFREALHRADPLGGFAVLYIWGAGGVGKSALLRRLGDEAEAAGRTVVRVDARAIDRSPNGFREAAADARNPGRVLLVDTFEAGQGMEGWFWDVFLPDLPADTTVVLASRQPPDPSRSLDPEWSAAVRVAALGILSPSDAATLLGHRGVTGAVADSLYAFAGGNPLALVLAAEVAARSGTGSASWTPHEPTIKMLLDRLIGDLPSAMHRRALEICAHVLVTREDLLRSLFGEDGAELFAWLRDQPFIDANPQGLRPHDLVRDLLVADLRWRDPQAWRVMNQQVEPYFLQAALNAAEPDVLSGVSALKYLHRHGDLMRYFITWRERGEVYEDAYRESDRDAVLRMAERVDGPAEAVLVDYWLGRQPEAFRVCRRPGDDELVAFAGWLRLTSPDETDVAADPLVGEIWAHVLEHRPLRAGAKIVVQRFVNVGRATEQPDPITDLFYMRGTAICLREPDLAWTYIVVPDADGWTPVLEYEGHQRLTGALSSVFAHDWTAVPRGPWLDLLQDRLLNGPAPEPRRPPSVAPARPDFERAVRDLLRGWHHRLSVESNPLINTRLAGDGPLTERIESLRAAVEEAVDTMPGTARGDRLHRTLAVTFFHGSLTQEAAAERLGIAFGTYRHRLASAIEHVTEQLWQRATGGTP
jgi:hypothetical protein